MKKIICVLLAVLMLFTVCGCGNGEESKGEYVYKDTFLENNNPENPTVMGLFYRNVIGAKIVSDDPAVKEIDKKADAMLKKVEDFPDDITVTGKTYYLSNEGDDKNDGLTPETARKTYEAVSIVLKEGDAVLFRRGDIFRGQMKLTSGVTYAAYGEGVKPRLYGSRDGKESEWVATDEEDIYEYTGITGNYSNIIFNNGEFIGRPVQSRSQLKKRELNVYLGSRLTIYSPNGNPGEIFNNIEIVDGYCLCTGSGVALKNVKFQNLCMMYTGVHFFGALGPVYGMEIEGCIMGYCGGRDLYKGSKAISLGNCVEFWSVAVDINIHDNYFFQAFDAALTHQGPTTVKADSEQVRATNYTNIHYENNLIEYCTYDIEAFSCREQEMQANSPDGTFTYNDVYVKGNICRYTGWGWGSLDRPDKNVYNVFKYDAEGENNTNIHVKPLYIENNIFDRPRRGVLGISSPDWNKANMILKNNEFYMASNSKIISDLTIKDDYMSAINKKFTAEGNTFKLVK